MKAILILIIFNYRDQPMHTMKRYSILPVTLYRFQSEQIPILRQKKAQKILGRPSFDFLLGQNGLYNPTLGDKYLGPNGLSMRPMGLNLAEFSGVFTGNYIYQLPKGLIIPDNFIVIHERTDHFSFQTTKPIKPEQFCRQAGQFFMKQRNLTIDEISKLVQQHFE